MTLSHIDISDIVTCCSDALGVVGTNSNILQMEGYAAQKVWKPLWLTMSIQVKAEFSFYFVKGSIFSDMKGFKE